MKRYQMFFVFAVCIFSSLCLAAQPVLISLEDELGIALADYDTQTHTLRLGSRGTGPASWGAVLPTPSEQRQLARAGMVWDELLGFMDAYAPYLTTRAVRCVQGVWVFTHTERHPYWNVLPEILASTPDFLSGVSFVALEPDGVWMLQKESRAFDRLKSVTEVWLQEVRMVSSLMYDSGEGITQVSDVFWGWPTLHLTLSVHQRIALPQAQLTRPVSAFEALLRTLRPALMQGKGVNVPLDSLATDLRGQTVTATDGAHVWTLRYDDQGRVGFVSQDRDPVFGPQTAPQSHQVLVFSTKTEADDWHRTRYADVDICYVRAENTFYLSSKGQRYLLGAPTEITRVFSVVMGILFDR